MAVDKEMKSFKHYITEKPAKLSATLPYKGAEWKDFRGLENPNEKEIITAMNKSRMKELRFVVDGKGKMWAWDSNDALHDAVIFAQTGEKYKETYRNYAKGYFYATTKTDKEAGPATNLKVIVVNSSQVGTDFALKNKTLKALAKRINSKGDDRVFWSDDRKYNL